MQEWQKQLAHDKVVRNAIALCNGIDPASFQDPDNGLIQLKPHQQRKFIGPLVQSHLQDHGHNSSNYETCLCRNS